MDSLQNKLFLLLNGCFDETSRTLLSLKISILALIPFWSKPGSTFGLLTCNDAAAIHLCSPYDSIIAPTHRAVLAELRSFRKALSRVTRRLLFPKTSHPEITPHECFGRILRTSQTDGQPGGNTDKCEDGRINI